MIKSKLLKKLTPNKSYLLYDEIYEYKLQKHKDNSYHLSVYGNPYNTFYIYEKDLEHFLSETVDDSEMYDFYKYDYKYNGYTNRYKCLSSVGFLSSFADFWGFSQLNFFAEIKSEKTIEELRDFIKRTGQRSKLREQLRKYRNGKNNKIL